MVSGSSPNTQHLSLGDHILTINLCTPVGARVRVSNPSRPHLIHDRCLYLTLPGLLTLLYTSLSLSLSDLSTTVPSSQRHDLLQTPLVDERSSRAEARDEKRKKKKER